MTPTLLTAREVAHRLHEKPQTVVRRLRRMELRGVKTGRQWLVSEADLQAFLDARANVAPVDSRRKRKA